MNILSKLQKPLRFIANKLHKGKGRIPDSHHVSRLLKPSSIDSGVVLSSGFEYKRDKDKKLKEREISVNWLEFFNKKASIEQNIENVRLVFHNKKYELKKNGRFAVLNVKKIRQVVEEGASEHTELVSLITKHNPSRNDSSHSSIFGIPFDPEGEQLVATILASYANDTKLLRAKK